MQRELSGTQGVPELLVFFLPHYETHPICHTPARHTHMYIHILTPQCVQYVGESNCAYYYSLLLRMLCQMCVNHKGHLLGLIAGGHVAHMTA